MKVVLLAGGLGTRLSEETALRPKPMVEIGGMPILWHIMNIYGHHNFKEFYIALGYMGDVVKNYFINYRNLRSDLTISLKNGEVSTTRNYSRDWTVHLIDTGSKNMTGGRLYRLRDRLYDSGTFMLTYGDGVSNVDISRLLAFHRSHGKIATVTAVRPTARFGGIKFNGDSVCDFKEKPQAGEGWINGGFFVFEPTIFDYISGDDVILESEPMENLVKDGQLMAYRHEGFWQCMDTIRDKANLEELWDSAPPWKVWVD